MIKRGRGRPRKYPKPPQKNTDINPESIADEDSDANNSKEIPTIPTKIKDIEDTSVSNEDLNAESSEDQETFVMPETWQTVDWETLRAEGWRPHLKRTNGREYVTIRVTWTEDDGSHHSKERSFGPYDPKKYEMLKNILSPDLAPKDFTKNRTDNEEPIEAEESSESKPIQMPEGRTLPSRYMIKEARILRSPVGKSISIPNQFYYDTDILEFFEYFKNKGYIGNIVDWIHECVRNYLILRHYKVGVIFERGNT